MENSSDTPVSAPQPSQAWIGWFIGALSVYLAALALHAFASLVQYYGAQLSAPTALEEDILRRMAKARVIAYFITGALFPVIIAALFAIGKNWRMKRRFFQVSLFTSVFLLLSAAARLGNGAGSKTARPASITAPKELHGESFLMAIPCRDIQDTTKKVSTITVRTYSCGIVNPEGLFSLNVIGPIPRALTRADFDKAAQKISEQFLEPVITSAFNLKMPGVNTTEYYFKAKNEKKAYLEGRMRFTWVKGNLYNLLYISSTNQNTRSHAIHKAFDSLSFPTTKNSATR